LNEAAQKQILRSKAIDAMRQDFDRALEERVNRYLEINHVGIIPNTHFSAASSQCINLYRDGYYIACVMMCQAVNEGIVKFVAERNKDHLSKSIEVMLQRLRKAKHVTGDFVKSSRAIAKSFRNDVHHMNPTVGKVDFAQVAKDNILRLAQIEEEVFGFTPGDRGTIHLKQPKYWDINPDGTTSGYLRLE